MGLLKKLLEKFNFIFNKRLIYQDKTKRTIHNQEKINFSSHSSYHLIVIAARVKSEKQLGEYITDDEDLTVKIDNKTFPKLNSDSIIDSPAAFSGGKLHDLAKTIYFLAFLHGTEHTIILSADEPINTATFESLKIYILKDLKKKFKIKPNIQAEDGDRRPWLTFVLDNFPIKSIKSTITYSRRKQDSDDVKVKINGKIQTSFIPTRKHFFWKFIGSLLSWEFPTKTKTKGFWTWLPPGLHYIEFDADRMPVLRKLIINFGEKPSIPKRPGSKQIPTVDNPKWTGDFRDDTEDILLARLIFGEAKNQSEDAKIGIGFTVVNRVKKQRPNWGFSIKEVILKENQYDALWNPITSGGVQDPLNNADILTQKAWKESYNIARGILDESLEDPSSGATNFHSYKERKGFPDWAADKNFKIKIGNTYFYELES
ncbi:cell wall hydrolase [Patescibacteria group bacterium]|nr:cell wall hydrolase [Patescibacteria group bacterium]